MLRLLLYRGVNYFQRLDRETALKRGEQIGSLLYITGYRNKVILKNLDIAFPELSKEEKINIASDVLKHFGRNIVEFIRIPIYVKNNEILKIGKIIEGIDILNKYKGKGAILITGHIGNWEIQGAVLEALNYKTSVLAYRQKNREINKFIENIRK